jgi:hypothetical protein
MQETRTLPVRIDWEEHKFGAQVKAPGFLLTTQADTVEGVLANLRNLVADYLAHEGINNPEWQNIVSDAVTFDCEYDLTAFFEHFKELKISGIATRAGINPNLLQQYVSGNKRASESQAKKIQMAVHLLANELRQIALT